MSDQPLTLHALHQQPAKTCSANPYDDHIGRACTEQAHWCLLVTGAPITTGRDACHYHLPYVATSLLTTGAAGAVTPRQPTALPARKAGGVL